MSSFRGKFDRKRVFRGKLPFTVGPDGVPIVFPKKQVNLSETETEKMDESIQEKVNQILEQNFDFGE